MNVNYYLSRPLPEELNGLAVLALDLRWSWNHGADALWETHYTPRIVPRKLGVNVPLEPSQILWFR